MIPNNELAAMRAQSTASADTPCTIQRPTRTQSATGAATETLGAAVATVCSTATPTASMLAQYSDRLANLVAIVVRLPYGTDIAANDVIAIGSRKLRVMVVLTPNSYSIANRVLAVEVA